MKAAARNTLRDYGIAVIAAVLVALVIRSFVLGAYRIPTSAMRPTLEPGDMIFAAKWPLGFRRDVKRGDVVVFAQPAEPDRIYVKRALALEGDTVSVRKGRVILNGKAIDAPGSPGAACGNERLPASGRAYSICWEPPLVADFGPEKVPAGSVFVLGDLRMENPLDSKKRRSWGVVPIDAIQGKAVLTWLSVEPGASGDSSPRFPRFRFERMFRRID